jgi:hypothetical protein
MGRSLRGGGEPQGRASSCLSHLCAGVNILQGWLEVAVSFFKAELVLLQIPACGERYGVRGSPEEAGRHWWREGEGEEEVQRKEERASAIQLLEGASVVK